MLRGGLAARLELGLPCWSAGSINVALLVSGAGGGAALCDDTNSCDPGRFPLSWART